MADSTTKQAISTTSGALSGAVTGTALAPGIGTVIGGLIGSALSFFGSQDNSSKKIQEVKNDISNNLSQSKGYYDALLTGKGTFGQYTPLLTNNDLPYIQQLFSNYESSIQQNPYSFDTGQSYTSIITGASFQSREIPIAQAIDSYLQNKGTQSTMTVQSAQIPSAITQDQFDILRNAINSIIPASPNSNDQVIYLVIGAVIFLIMVMFLKRR